MLRFLLLFWLILPTWVEAQFLAPPASPPAVARVTAGYTELAVDYHRPAVRGRLIFGDLIPYGEVWRAGANENTILRLSQPVVVGGRNVAAGAYALYVIPRQDADWTWILNADTSRWGAQGYTPEADVLRVDAPARRLTERTESLEYRWMNLTHGAVDLAVEWEWYRLALPVQLHTDAEVAHRADRHLSPAAHPDDYYEAARYYLETGDLPLAKRWIDGWAAATGPQFGRTRRQALIEKQLGNDSLAHRLLTTSLELAQAAGNDHYIRLNQRTQREWMRQPVGLPPDTLLARSLHYHDPAGAWGMHPYALTLSESRPGNGTRLTDLRLSPGENDFILEQQAGEDRIHLSLEGGEFSYSLHGRSDLADSLRQARNLTRERAELLRDYYGYLWGLPMKLTDPGTLLRPRVHRVWYGGRELLELEVGYAADTGDDVWFFLFDPRTYALSGYRFYHAAEGPGTGEFILVDEEVEVEGFTLPAIRHWYRTVDNLYLGTDRVVRPE